MRAAYGVACLIPFLRRICGNKSFAVNDGRAQPNVCAATWHSRFISAQGRDVPYPEEPSLSISLN